MRLKIIFLIFLTGLSVACILGAQHIKTQNDEITELVNRVDNIEQLLDIVLNYESRARKNAEVGKE